MGAQAVAWLRTQLNNSGATPTLRGGRGVGVAAAGGTAGRRRIRRARSKRAGANAGAGTRADAGGRAGGFITAAWSPSPLPSQSCLLLTTRDG